jgi:hypothetical protein
MAEVKSAGGSFGAPRFGAEAGQWFWLTDSEFPCCAIDCEGDVATIVGDGMAASMPTAKSAIAGTDPIPDN